GELKRGDDRQCELGSSAGATADLDAEPGDDPIPAGGPDAESERLAAELADRDETIRLLLDELERLEAAQAATRTEWEHLAGWVAELEGRVDGQDSGALRQLEERLVSQQQEEDTRRQRWEGDRRDWETQRQILEAEIARLQSTVNLAATAGGDDVGPVHDCHGSAAAAVEALQAENVRLRAAWQELAERSTAAERSESLDEKLALELEQRQELRHQLQQMQDE